MAELDLEWVLWHALQPCGIGWGVLYGFFARFEMEHHRPAIERKIRLNMTCLPHQPVLYLCISYSYCKQGNVMHLWTLIRGVTLHTSLLNALQQWNFSVMCNQIHLGTGIKTWWFDSTEIALQRMKSLGHKQYLVLLRSILCSLWFFFFQEDWMLCVALFPLHLYILAPVSSVQSNSHTWKY